MTGRSFGGVDFGKLFVSIDAMDTEGFLGFIAPDGEFRFGAAPADRGLISLYRVYIDIAPFYAA